MKLAWPSHKLTCYSSLAIRTTSESGQGVYSLQEFKTGAVIISEKPLLASGEIEFRDLAKILLALPEAKRRAIFSLADVHSGCVYSSPEELHDEAVRCFAEMGLRESGGGASSAKDGERELDEVARMSKVHQSTIGILRTNSIPLGETGYHGLYAVICRANHSCCPNATYSWREDLGKHVLVCLRPISPGDEICVSYVDFWCGRDDRRQKLKDGFCFDCSCERCTEEDGDVSGSISARTRTFLQIERTFKAVGSGSLTPQAAGEASALSVKAAKQCGIDTPQNLKQLHGDATQAFEEAARRAPTAKDGKRAQKEADWHRKEMERLEDICYGRC
jgi:hypothetical protein